MKASKRLLVAACLGVALLSANVGRAEILAKDLFDNVTDGDVSIGGQNYAATGFTGAWSVPGSDLMFTARNFNTLPAYGPPSQDTNPGGVWQSGGGGPNYQSNAYTARSLTSSAQINLGQDGVYYFSFKGRRGGDDIAGFMGLSTGASATNSFVDVGWTWGNCRLVGETDADPVRHATSFIGQGTMDTENGAYNIRSAGSDWSISAGSNRFFVARITASAAGSDRIDLKVYSDSDAIDNNLSTIAWTNSYSFQSSDVLNHVILGMNGGSGGGEVDAFRLGTTWTDVTGVNTVPEPGAMCLLGAGVLGLLAYAWRRRK